jgi:hypothetical protein
MHKYRTISIAITSAALLVVAGCTRFTGNNFTNGRTRTPTATAVAIKSTPPPTLAATATSDATRVPAVTQNILGLLLTQAYSQITPAPTATEPNAAVTTAPTMLVSTGGAVPPTAESDRVPASLILNEPIQIENAINTVDCKIRGVGDCATSMQAGNTIFLTWTFGVGGDRAFHWGQAAVVITRDGETFKWSQAGNGLVKPPAKDAGWTLNVGQSAKFAGSLDNAQPGYYVARLWMCTLTTTECNAGQGWQSVGGEAVQFVIVP